LKEKSCEGEIMQVSDILRLKGNTLFKVSPTSLVMEAVDIMADHDIGSLVVLDQGALVGMLTFREIIQNLAKHQGDLDQVLVGAIMEKMPLVCEPQTELDEVRKMMLERHARYLPVLDGQILMGVISFYDVAKSVVEAQGFENTMLKAYIRDWPSEAK
jgi:CBS domain-containing protein